MGTTISVLMAIAWMIHWQVHKVHRTMVCGEAMYWVLARPMLMRITVDTMMEEEVAGATATKEVEVLVVVIMVVVVMAVVIMVVVVMAVVVIVLLGEEAEVETGEEAAAVGAGEMVGAGEVGVEEMGVVVEEEGIDLQRRYSFECTRNVFSTI